MRELLNLLWVALLPVAGNLLGTLAAELLRPPHWVVGAALHAAGGVAIALVSVELMPRVIDTTPAWLITMLFALGASLSVGLYHLLRAMQGERTPARAGAWMVYVATGVDLMTDGIMTGASSAVSAELGLLLGASQIVGNVPAGFATVANLRRSGVHRSIRALASLLLLLPVLVAALSGYYLLRGAPETTQDAALAAIAGVLLVSTIEDLVPQADEPGTARWLSTTSFVLGFSFFTLLTGSVK
jgi:zinc transporter, ZIP family